MSPSISVIIPTYNRLKDLKRAIRSVYSQTFIDWEIIVIDNNSSDGTKEYIKKINDSKVRFFSIKNQGIIALSRNLGIKNARGKYIAFLDSDDWWSPKKLEISYKYLNDGAGIVYHDLYRVKKHNQFFHFSKAKTRQLKLPIIDDLLFNGWAINNSSVVLLTSLMDGIEGFSEKKALVGAEDYDAWLKISQLTDNFVKIPITLGYYWEGGGNTSSPKRVLMNIKEIESIYKEKIEKFELSDYFFHNYFVKGRANFLLGSYYLAKKNLDVVLSKKIPIKVYLKTQLMNLIIKSKKYEKYEKY